MHSEKCNYCSLVNLASDTVCRRCGHELSVGNRKSNAPRSPREAAKSGSWLYTILFLTLIGGVAYYLFSGVEKSYSDVKASEANRISAQPKQQAGLSRSEMDKQRAGQYGNAVQNSPGLATSQKHNEEIKQLMQAGSNQPQK